MTSCFWKTNLRQRAHREISRFPGGPVRFCTELKSPSQISEAFNKHFTMVGPKLTEKIEIQPSDDPLKYLGDKTGGTKFKGTVSDF